MTVKSQGQGLDGATCHATCPCQHEVCRAALSKLETARDLTSSASDAEMIWPAHKMHTWFGVVAVSCVEVDGPLSSAPAAMNRRHISPDYLCRAPVAGDSNPEHFFVATQDRELRAAIDRVPGGASIFASVNGLHLQASCSL